MSSRSDPPFDAQAFLESTGINKKAIDYRSGDAIFSQGDACDAVMYIQHGSVKLSVLATSGREAVVAMLGSGDFFGEGSLTGQPTRLDSATAQGSSTVLRIEVQEMLRLLHTESAFSDRFITHVLARNIRVEADLVDQLFNSCEKRLARTLLILARHGKQDQPTRRIPKISQETLAEMVGTTRSRVNFFMNKFRRLGFIEYKDGLIINKSLLSLVLLDSPGDDLTVPSQRRPKIA